MDTLKKRAKERFIGMDNQFYLSVHPILKLDKLQLSFMREKDQIYCSSAEQEFQIREDSM
jgi:hypothetical protein